LFIKITDKKEYNYEERLHYFETLMKINPEWFNFIISKYDKKNFSIEEMIRNEAKCMVANEMKENNIK
jgi:hypothetical protein